MSLNFMPTVSVVIPTLQEELYIERLLISLQKQSYQPCEVFVVDGGSTDKTVSLVRAYPFVTLLETHSGVAHQRNYGGMQAKGDVLLFLDADTELSEQFLEKSISSFASRRLDFACPLFVPVHSLFWIYCVFWYVNIIFVLLQKLLPSGAGPGIIIRREIFRESGGFKEGISFEDMEFIRRVARKHGFGVLLHKLYVSDRRFRKYGFWKMLLLYSLLSFLFTFNRIDLAQRVQYRFDGYK